MCVILKLCLVIYILRYIHFLCVCPQIKTYMEAYEYFWTDIFLNFF